ncbi:hypothetical protein PEC18_04800 [Paucibacter sp. O1-1]|nr:hypothetical protein [Paucibacter sp. O1-1]MDA3825190.1 hypothetical protein [Paucibacter sp. O1-1]
MSPVPAYYMFLPWQVLLRYIGSLDRPTDSGALCYAIQACDDADVSPDEADFRSELGIKMKEFKKIKGKYQGKVCYKIEEIWHKRFHKNDSIISLEGFPDFVRLGKDVIEFKEHGYPKGGRSRFHADIDTMLRLHRDDDVRSRLALVICGMALDAISLNSKIADASIVESTPDDNSEDI